MIAKFNVLSTDNMDSLDSKIRAPTKCFWKINGTIKIYLPTDIQKSGSSYDLTLAIGILAASEQIAGATELEDYYIIGELSLDGSLQPIRGALPIVLEARKHKKKGVILPIQNAREAAIVQGIDILGAANIKQVIDFFDKGIPIEPTRIDVANAFNESLNHYEYDFSDVKGQENIKRAMEIAAAGGHNVILIGPPGSGKTMLAKRLPSILPPLCLEEALETTKIHSVAGKMSRYASIISTRPFRSPHHTISDVALVGGGTHPQPGEISLAHNGVLFLDELPEFKRQVLEVMRQPLEERRVTISRSKYSVEFPASFMFIAATNPCPCGNYNHPTIACTCKPFEVQNYLSKISGPLMDRLGLSARAYDRILKVARTIADLDNSPNIEIGHLSEAINFRNLDRDNWGRR